MRNKPGGPKEYAQTRPVDTTRLEPHSDLPTSKAGVLPNTGPQYEESMLLDSSEPHSMKLLHMIAGIIPVQRERWYLYVFPALIWFWNLVPWSIHLLLIFDVLAVKRWTDAALQYSPSLTQNLSGLFLYLSLYGIEYSLYRTRESFNKKIQQFASRHSIATHTRRTFGICLVTGVLLATLLFVIYIVNVQVKVHGIVSLVCFSFLSIVPIMAVVGLLLSRALAFNHIFSQQYKELKSIAKGNDANKVHITCVSMTNDITDHFSAYLSLPLQVCITLALATAAFNLISIYASSETPFVQLVYEIVFAFLPIVMIAIPCLVLVKLDLLAFEVKEIICRNSLMKRTDFTALLLSYELIIPRVKVFGMKITFNLVASLLIPMIGSLLPRLVQWLVDAAYY